METAISRNSLPTFAALQSAISRYGPYDMATRLVFGQMFGFGIPCHETVSAVASFYRILEVGAGSGFWSYWLRQRGCDVIATDPTDPPSQWLDDIVRVDAQEALRKFHGRAAVLLVWPHFVEDWPVALVRNLPRKTALCYVGEGPYGCCAPLQFFLELGRQSLKMIYAHPSPSWAPTRDFLTIYYKE
jgi:hypothetical protein